MDKLLIHGGRRLEGEIAIAGAKNAALPELCAALLVGAPVRLANVPRLQDVATTLKLLRTMGARAERVAETSDEVVIDATGLKVYGEGEWTVRSPERVGVEPSASGIWPWMRTPTRSSPLHGPRPSWGMPRSCRICGLNDRPRHPSPP